MSQSQTRKRTGGFSALAAKRGEVSSLSGNRHRKDSNREAVNDSDEGIQSSSSSRSADRTRKKRLQDIQRRQVSDDDNNEEDYYGRNRGRSQERSRGRTVPEEKDSDERSDTSSDRRRGGRPIDWRRNRDSDEEVRKRDENRQWDRDRRHRSNERESPRNSYKEEDRFGRNRTVSPHSPSVSGSSDSEKNWRTTRARNQEDVNDRRTSPRWNQSNSNSRDSDSPSSLKDKQPVKTQLRGQSTSLDRLSTSNSSRLRGIRESDEDTTTPPNLKMKSSYLEDRPLSIRRSNESPNSDTNLHFRRFNKLPSDSDIEDSKRLIASERLKQSVQGRQTPPRRDGASLLALSSNSPLSVSPRNTNDFNASLASRQTMKKPITFKSSDSLLNSPEKPFNSNVLTRRLDRLDGRIVDPPALTDALSRGSNNSAINSLNGSVRSVRSLPSKEKSFLVGSPSSSCGSMLGAAELVRVFPQRRVRIYILTWNMASPKSDNSYPSSWDELLLPAAAVNEVCDIFVIALQETPSNSREILLRIQETLGPGYVPLSSDFYGTLGICVFMNRDLVWYCSVPQTANIKTRHTLMTKGATAIALQLFGTSFVFLSTHLKSDVGNIEHRIEDYNKILRGIDLPKPINGSRDSAVEQLRKARDLTQRFDYTFWAGDLNFRITASKETVESMAQAIESGEIPRYESLLKIDELFLIQTESKAFEAFQEGRINFPPTYKYDLNSDSFDTSHLNRIPAYTDRVLYHCKQKVTCSCMHYDSVRMVKTSDHRAVFAVFECDLKPGRDNMPLCAGDFDRNIYREGIRRRANHLDYVVQRDDKSNSKVCTVS